MHAIRTIQAALVLAAAYAVVGAVLAVAGVAYLGAAAAIGLTTATVGGRRA